MPDFWTHILAGEHIVEKSEYTEYKNIVKGEEKYFNFGCQGSDLFFYNFSTPWRGPALGKKMHYEKLDTAFWQSINYGKLKNNSPEIMAFLTGYLTHYLVDRYLHAFILARVNNFTMHKCLENEIDSFLLEHFRDIKARNINPFYIIKFDKELPAAITEFFRIHLQEVYEEKQVITTLEHSYRDFKYLQYALFSPGPVKRAILRAANTVIPYNVDSLLYEAGNELLWPEEKNRFLRYYEETVNFAGEIMAYIFAYWLDELDKSSLVDKISVLDFSGPDRQEIISTLPDTQRQRLIS